MEKLRHEIRRVRRYNLKYYDSHLSLIERYTKEKPDISIETCKALIEGISKLVLHVLKQEPLKSQNKDKFHYLFKKAILELKKGRGFYDISILRMLEGVVKYIGDLRNDHCDIGHGRASLKNQINDADFAEFIIGITDCLCTYMLRRLDLLTEKEVLYEDNPEFNTYLDESNPMPGKILYSKALFEQEFQTYELQLDEYNDMLEDDQEQ